MNQIFQFFFFHLIIKYDIQLCYCLGQTFFMKPVRTHNLAKSNCLSSAVNNLSPHYSVFYQSSDFPDCGEFLQSVSLTASFSVATNVAG